MFEFDQSQAKAADRGGLIDSSGVYRGQLTKALVFTNDSGAGGVEFAFENDEGSSADFIRVYTQKRDGGKAFGLGQIHSAMGLLGLDKLEAVEHEPGERHLDGLCNKPIAVALQREEYERRDGGTGFKMNLQHFFDYDTGQTYGEKVDGKPAKKIRRKIRDRVARPLPGRAADVNDSDPGFDEDDLPF